MSNPRLNHEARRTDFLYEWVEFFFRTQRYDEHLGRRDDSWQGQDLRKREG